MTLTRRAVLRALLAAALLPGCAGRPAPPTADAPVAPPPSLAGHAVFVLPVQGLAGSGGEGGEALAALDQDVAWFLAERAAAVRWIFPPAVEEAARDARTLRIEPRQLQVDVFHRMKVRRIGDPLFGDLHSLGVLLDARYALLPYAAAWVREPGGTGGRVELALAIIDTSDGDVLWTGVVAGEPAAAGSPAATASAASALAGLLAR